MRYGQVVSATTYGIVMSNRDTLPNWINDKEIRLILNPRNWDSITTVRPYLFAEKQTQGPPPRDELFDGKSQAASR